MKKFFRKVRRTICRYIVGFDNCPLDYRKDYFASLLLRLSMFGVIVGALLGFSFFFVIFN